MPGEFATDSSVTPEVKQRQIIYQVIDSITTELCDRYQNLKEVSDDFNFLNGASFSSMSLTDIEKCINDLCTKYPRDLDPVEFLQEAESFRFQAQELFEFKNKSPLEIFLNLHKFDLLTEYPNFAIAIRIFLTLPVTSASCERSFSKLKLIKNFLRSTMCQNRLSHTALISIERSLTDSISFETYISEFAAQKARKILYLK